MKKIKATLLLAMVALLTLSLCGCEYKVQESYVIDKRYVAPYQTVETHGRWQWSGDYVRIPVAVNKPEEHYLVLEQTYENGNTGSKEVQVDKATYEQYGIGDRYE